MTTIKYFRFIFYLLILCACIAHASNSISIDNGTDAWTVYCFGDSNILFEIFNSIRALIKSGVFTSLINLVLIIGLGWSLFIAIGRDTKGIDSTLKWMLGVAFAVRLLLGFTVNIALDSYTNADGNKTIIEVPAMIGIPASILSQIGHGISVLIDEAYSNSSGMPKELTLTGGINGNGSKFNVSAQLLLYGSQYQMADPYMKNSLSHFTTDCVIPLIASGNIKISEFLGNSNIWKLIGTNAINPAIMTVYYGNRDVEKNNNGLVMSCLDAYVNLQDDLKTTENQLANDVWKKDATPRLAQSLFNTVLNYNTQFSSYEVSASEYLMQSAIIDILQHNVIENLTRSPSLFTSINIHKSEKNTVSAWILSAKLFESVFGYIYASIEILVYAIGPILLLFMLLPGAGLKVFGQYMQLIAWFPMTLILLAISNNVLTCWTQHAFFPIWREFGGLSIISRDFILAHAAKMVEVGTWLNTLIPVLAWAIISRSNTVITDLLSSYSISSSVSQSALAMNSGNVALNNQRISNINAMDNSFSSALHSDIGSLPISMNMMGSAMNTAENLGGRSFLLNNVLATQNRVKDKTDIFETNNEKINSKAMQSSYRNSLHNTQRSIDVSNDYILKGKDELVGGLTTFIMQQKLIRDYQLSYKEMKNLSENIVSATMNSIMAAKNELQSDFVQSKKSAKRAKDDFATAYRYLIERIGNNENSHVLTGDLITTGVAGITASAISTTGLASDAEAHAVGKHLWKAFSDAGEVVGMPIKVAETILSTGMANWQADTKQFVEKKRANIQDTLEKNSIMTFMQAVSHGITETIVRKTTLENNEDTMNYLQINKEVALEDEKYTQNQDSEMQIVPINRLVTQESYHMELNQLSNKTFINSLIERKQ